ncbi:putative E3 ubiquitin-protein ligase protein, partial [Dissostichus eleginoides]
MGEIIRQEKKQKRKEEDKALLIDQSALTAVWRELLTLLEVETPAASSSSDSAQVVTVPSPGSSLTLGT